MGDTIMHTYTRQPVTFSKGEGAWLLDNQGKRYLDALSGIAVCGLGHAHPEVTEAICQQAGTLMHTSNLYQVEKQQLLADKLCAISGMDRVFFSNSGAEANEAAIKLARLYGHKKGIKSPEIIVMENSFHGRTMATLTATGNRKVQAGFEPLVKGFVRAPFNHLDAIKSIAHNSNNVVAILVEPVQGESGIRVPSKDYLNGIREICNEHGWLMMLDEIQTGMARTGQWFAFQHNAIKPDVMTLAKGLGNGVPIGACLAAGEAADVLQPGNHGSTFGGNPLACNAALSVIRVIEDNKLVERAATLGASMVDKFRDQLQDIAGVTEIRTMGLMFGIQLDRPCGELVGRALEKGLLINVAAESSIRLLPPLIITDEEADQIVDTVCSLVKDFLSE
jgi:acetylornithine aminotransferase